ncbi:MAG: hypothetical protein NXI31_26275 [bacterium]|nr:hypothetical protein [bacterium]
MMRPVVWLILSAGLANASLVGQNAAPVRLTSAAFDRVLSRVQVKLDKVDIHEDHSTWQDPWVVESTHFQVRTTGGYGYGREIAAGLEERFEEFQRVLGIKHRPTRKLPILLVPDVGTYNQFGDNSDEHSSFYGSFHSPNAGGAVVASFHPNAAWMRMQVTHSAVHQWVADAFPQANLPVWVNEGLAAYFTLSWDYYYHLDQFEKLKQENKLLSLQRLLREPMSRYGDATGAQTRFVELAMLFCYLIRFREDTRTQSDDGEGPFRDYLVLLLKNRSTRASELRDMFVSDIDALEKAFFAYEFPR